MKIKLLLLLTFTGLFSGCINHEFFDGYSDSIILNDHSGISTASSNSIDHCLHLAVLKIPENSKVESVKLYKHLKQDKNYLAMNTSQRADLLRKNYSFYNQFEILKGVKRAHFYLNGNPDLKYTYKINWIKNES